MSLGLPIDYGLKMNICSNRYIKLLFFPHPEILGSWLKMDFFFVLVFV